MSFTIPILTADDLAARAEAEIASMPTTHLTTHVPAGADRIASRLHGRRDHFRLPSPSLEAITRSGSRHTPPAGAHHRTPLSGSISFAGYRPETRYRGVEREHSLVPHFESHEVPTPVTGTSTGGSRREHRITGLVNQANSLMAGAELDIRLARGATGERREAILTRARECFDRAERLVHRAEGLARAGRVPPALRAELSDARLRSDTADFAMGA